MGKRRHRVARQASTAPKGRHLYRYTIHAIPISGGHDQGVYISSDAWADNIQDLIDFFIEPRYSATYDIWAVKLLFCPNGVLTNQVTLNQGQFVSYDKFVEDVAHGKLRGFGRKRRGVQPPNTPTRPNTYEIQGQSPPPAETQADLKVDGMTPAPVFMPQVFAGVPDYLKPAAKEAGQ